jgi:hypothetical protein
MTNSAIDSTATAYAAALAAGQPQRLLGLLSTAASFRSPFSLWQTQESVAAAVSARCRAFRDLQVERVLQDGDHAVVLWHAEVDGRAVEGCEALTLSAGRVSHVDVFLRPAAILEPVRVAMAAAWPRTKALTSTLIDWADDPDGALGRRIVAALEQLPHGLTPPATAGHPIRRD